LRLFTFASNSASFFFIFAVTSSFILPDFYYDACSNFSASFKYAITIVSVMRVEISKHIVADSEICHGKPTFKGTRVLVSDVIELVADGVPAQEIIRDYYPSLSKSMIKDALEWAAKVVGGGHRVSYAKIPA